MTYLLGFDIGSSSVKAALVSARSRQTVAVANWPKQELSIQASQPGWAEQEPDEWWNCCQKTVEELLQRTGIQPHQIEAIGIAYQMHGLVLVGKDHQPIRPSIIWCDSRAVRLGENAYNTLGQSYCMQHFLNSPGNFTASKLKWVLENEPDTIRQIQHFLLPGDYIALKMTGTATTTVSGLSEGILWDFQSNQPAYQLLEHLQIPTDWIPEIKPTFGHQGSLTAEAAQFLGLQKGTPVTYRAGDQPNNALSLNTLQPGEVAATGGTSGVIYGVIDQLKGDPLNRVNSFAHVNHNGENPRIGVLLCINGAGSQYRWIRQQIALSDQSYVAMETEAQSVPPGAEGLLIHPFGNGAERMLGNQNRGATITGIDFNRHQRAHLYRAALEGIAFAFVKGTQVLQELGLNLSVLRAGNDNLFQSTIFSETIAQLTGSRIELYPTTGAVGAALAAGVGIGHWSSPEEGMIAVPPAKVILPKPAAPTLVQAFNAWNNLEQP